MSLSERVEIELGSRIGPAVTWFDYGMGKELPLPQKMDGSEVALDEFFVNNENSFFAGIVNFSDEEYEAYILQCEDFGFTIDRTKTVAGWEGSNSEGLRLHLLNFMDTNRQVVLDKK